MSYETTHIETYTAAEGTYTVELQRDGATAASNALNLMTHPRRRNRSRPRHVFGECVQEQALRIRILDTGGTIRDQILNDAKYRLKISGPEAWEGPLETIEDSALLEEESPRLDLRFRGGIDQLGTAFDLTGDYTIAELFYAILVDGIDGGPDKVRLVWDWSHDGQDSSIHEARGVRIPRVEELTEGNASTYEDVLCEQLEFWNSELRQEDGAWLIRKRSLSGEQATALEYDGSTYSTTTDAAPIALTEGDLINYPADRPDDTSLSAKRDVDKGIAEAVSVQLYDQTGFRNVEFAEVDDNDDPLFWTLSGTVTHETSGSESRVQMTAGSSFVEQVVNRPIKGNLVLETSRIEIEARLHISSSATEDTYDVDFAEAKIEGAGDRWYDETGNYHSSQEFITDQVQVEAAFRDTWTSWITFQIDTDDLGSTYGAPSLKLLAPDETDGAITIFDLVEFRKADWVIEYKSEPQSAVAFTGSSGGERREELRIPLGNRNISNPRFGVLEYFDGSDWLTASGAWGVSGVSGIHGARLTDRLDQAGGNVYGRDVRLPRDLGITPASAFTLDGTTYSIDFADGFLGKGPLRVRAFEVRDDYSSTVTSENEYED